MTERRRKRRLESSLPGAVPLGAGGAGGGGAVAGGGSGLPRSAVTRASMWPSTRSASASRPLASYQRGDSGTYFQASKAKRTGNPPRKNITRQPVSLVRDGMSSSASSGDRKYPTDRKLSAIPVNRPRTFGGQSSAAYAYGSGNTAPMAKPASTRRVITAAI